MKAALCAAALCVATLIACYDPVYDRPSALDSEAGVAVEEPDYERDIVPIWQRACGPQCHVAGSPDGGLTLDGGAEALVRKDASQTSFMALIEPEDPDRSYLWLKLEGRQDEAGGAGGPMPAAGSLSDADRQTLLNWIDDGAPY